MIRLATATLPIPTAYVLPTTPPRCGFATVPFPPVELCLPPPTAAELLADAAEEDLETMHAVPVTVAEKKALVQQRELIRWAEFRESTQRAEEDAKRLAEEEDAERIKMGKKSKLKVDLLAGEGLKGRPALDPRFVAFGSKVIGKGMEAMAPGARY